jgi:hypothetical protein
VDVGGEKKTVTLRMSGEREKEKVRKKADNRG